MPGASSVTNPLSFLFWACVIETLSVQVSVSLIRGLITKARGVFVPDSSEPRLGVDDEFPVAATEPLGTIEPGTVVPGADC